MTTLNASPAYRGYRLQAIYSLYRLLESRPCETVTFQPEGAEDLAMFGADGTLLELVQVKALTHDLVLSDFNPHKPDSSFYRINHYLALAPQARVRIVSYGSVGPELGAALGGDADRRQRVAARLSGYGILSKTEAEQLLARIELVTVHEAAILKSVDAFLRKSNNGSDPAVALSLMTAWLYECAERLPPESNTADSRFVLKVVRRISSPDGCFEGASITESEQYNICLYTCSAIVLGIRPYLVRIVLLISHTLNAAISTKVLWRVIKFLDLSNVSLF